MTPPRNVLPRRMLFGARPIRVAVGCQFIVAPEKRNSFAALDGVEKNFASPKASKKVALIPF